MSEFNRSVMPDTTPPDCQTFDLNAEATLPLYGFPKVVQDAICEVAEARQVARDYVLGAALATMATAVGSGVVQKGEYNNPCNLFIGLLGDSAQNKSQPLKDLFSYLGSVDKSYKDAYTIEKMRYDEEMRKRGKKDVGEAVKPLMRQIVMRDTTPEARLMVYRDNPNGVLWESDELKEMFDNMNRYNKSGEGSQLCSLYDGKSITINRKGDGMINIGKPYVSIYGTIQPAVLKAAFSKTDFVGNGLLWRFLWIHPQKQIRDFGKERMPDEFVMYDWDDFVQSLFKECNGKNMVVPLDNDAKKIFTAFKNGINDKEGHDASIGGKMHILVYKLACLAAVARACAYGFVDDVIVNAHDASWAVDCAIYAHRCATDVLGLCADRRESLQGASMGELTMEIKRRFPNANLDKLAEALGFAKGSKYLFKVVREERNKNNP